MAKSSPTRQKIETLQAQIEQLQQEEVHQLKLRLSDARAVVSDLEGQLAELTGHSGTKTRTRRARRPSITDGALQEQILKVMALNGKTGLNAKQLADKLNQDALRVRKFIAGNPKVLKRAGAGPSTKFFLP